MISARRHDSGLGINLRRVNLILFSQKTNSNRNFLQKSTRPTGFGTRFEHRMSRIRLTARTEGTEPA